MRVRGSAATRSCSVMRRLSSVIGDVVQDLRGTPRAGLGEVLEIRDDGGYLHGFQHPLPLDDLGLSPDGPMAARSGLPCLCSSLHACVCHEFD